MFKKLLIRLWNDRDQFFRYFLTGISAFIFDMTTLFAFKELFNFTPVFAVILNQFIVVIYLFLVNKYFSFKAKGDGRQQFLKFFTVMLFNYLVAVVWMWFWNEQYGYNYLLVRIVNIALSVSWNFLLYKFWVYKK